MASVNAGAVPKRSLQREVPPEDIEGAHAEAAPVLDGATWLDETTLMESLGSHCAANSFVVSIVTRVVRVNSATPTLSQQLTILSLFVIPTDGQFPRP